MGALHATASVNGHVKDRNGSVSCGQGVALGLDS